MKGMSPEPDDRRHGHHHGHRGHHDHAQHPDPGNGYANGKVHPPEVIHPDGNGSRRDRIRHGVSHALGAHSHDSADQVDVAMEADGRGWRALWISLGALGLTAIAQAVMVVVTGSVALLGDTLHNVADALTAVPLLIAFWLARRPPNERFTYGYGRAEDLAGLFVVAMIALSSVLAGYEAINRLFNPSRSGTSGRWPWPGSSVSSETNSSPATGAGLAARSVPRRWSPMVCTLVPTDSRLWPS